MQTISSLVYADPWSPVGISVTERSEFFIHGRGPKGSDGCIVPGKDSDLKSLLDVLKRETSVVALFVQNDGVNVDRFGASNFFRHAA